MTSIDIQFTGRQSKHPSKTLIQQWVKATFKKTKQSGSISIKIVDEEEMQALNRQYRHKDKPTNVLSFPCQLPAPLRGDLLGDIAICTSVVEKEAVEQNKPLTAHWAHMVIHGVLHLLGYDHEEQAEAAEMENLEKILLKELGFSDPYHMENVHE